MSKLYIPAPAIQPNFKPDFPVEIDWSNPVARGISKVFARVGEDAPAIGGITPLAGRGGRAFHSTSQTAYYQASTTKILSGQPVWSIMAVISTTQAAAASGRAIYCERAGSGNDIIKLDSLSAAFPGNTAGLTVRDDAAALFQLFGGPAINDGKLHVIHGVRYASTDHRLFIDGAQVATTATAISSTYTDPVDSRIGADAGDNTSFFNDPIYAVVLWPRALSAAEIASLSANPYQLLRPKQRDLYLVVNPIHLTGASTEAQTGSAQLSIAVPLTAASVQQQLGTGSLSIAIPLTGHTDQIQNALGLLAVGDNLTGASLAISSATGNLTTLVPLVGATVQAQLASGGIVVVVNLSGQSIQQDIANGSVTLRVNLAAQSTQTSLNSGNLTAGGALVPDTSMRYIAASGRIFKVAASGRNFKDSASGQTFRI